MILQTTLCLAAAAAVINFWLGMRIGQLRHALKVSVGDGGDERIIRRMRAQANFIENTPLLLILFGLIEMTGKGGVWLAPLGALFMLGRVLHGIGMDGKLTWGRMVGTLTAYLTALGLAVVAVLIALQVM
ncbi:MAPEG family protein [Novosphingobium aerophilum]|uniref:MAPEG family protein n=1 Tax=Novosphingobium aerophilum TaxID=2839843 RepID=A0A7X1F5B5_9SPHN|nr:MAPEG family protein [Novosphingobium aerophilum]MBC2650687.1 MAPEG family protein [Novosphingobium aerophilum]